MTAIDAYELILREVEEETRLRLHSSMYFEDMFGDFIISILDFEREFSIVNDKFSLRLCEDLNGERNCRTVLPSIRAASESEILHAVGLRRP